MCQAFWRISSWFVRHPTGKRSWNLLVRIWLQIQCILGTGQHWCRWTDEGDMRDKFEKNFTLLFLLSSGATTLRVPVPVWVIMLCTTYWLRTQGSCIAWKFASKVDVQAKRFFSVAWGHECTYLGCRHVVTSTTIGRIAGIQPLGWFGCEWTRMLDASDMKRHWMCHTQSPWLPRRRRLESLS